MTYIKLKIRVTYEWQDYVIAELNELGFEGFQQLDDTLITYKTEDQFLRGERERVKAILAKSPGRAFIQSEEEVVQQNWNKKWEQTIQAQTIGPFFVKPTWADDKVPQDHIVIEIDPKMAFGTGYHATTRLSLRALPRLIQTDDEVLDAGTGTGILAIAAVKLGAGRVFAFDIDAWSIKNARENISLNKVSKKMILKKGSTETVLAHTVFDVILANIERNTILDMIPFFAEHLKKEGRLFLSGLLIKDQELVVKKLQAYKLELVKQMQEKEWMGLWAKK